MVSKMNDNCKKCIHKKAFQSISNGEVLYLCMSEPYEEDDQFGIITWLDVRDFDSSECLNFKEA